ncbi:2-isopropylmalate synthase [Candidatus Magnetoovum chiemensis]|nr:2-isopropylmalate synthase [Candidatus Magnetoovum chiemensis]
MLQEPKLKYKPYSAIELPDRVWPTKTITKAPIWCSVDLRDGNQALAIPISVDKKLEMFNLLVEIGFKQIEVGFPSASKIEYDFLRLLIENKLIPQDVAIQVLTQAKEDLIEKTIESLQGVKRAIVHLYNSTSAVQRSVVFRKDKSEIIELALKGTRKIRQEKDKLTGSEITLQYSPESYTGTEDDFALQICTAVIAEWGLSADEKVIINLPATVETSTPNIYADKIEWFLRNTKHRDNIILSLHTHNDRGTAVAATELALMAGADRVEGTLFGNGERTGNVDIITLALNLYTQGINPNLMFHDINRIKDIYERTTNIAVHVRHPYAGELVYTAFSGSHQDAIKKGIADYNERKTIWEVPYLPIDPADVGRTYESIIRINSQSGKSGIAYVMEQEFGFKLPKDMCAEFAAIIQTISDNTGKEVEPQKIKAAFDDVYLKNYPLRLKTCNINEAPGLNEEQGLNADCGVYVKAEITIDGNEKTITGFGNGPIDAFCNALKKELNIDFTLLSYHEHAVGHGSKSKAVAYVQVESAKNRQNCFGVGIDTNISLAAFKAILSALNRTET